MRSVLARLSVTAAATVFFLMSTATATLANGPGITAPLLPFSIDVGSSVSTPHQSVVVPAAVRPALPADSGEGRRIVYAVRAQRIWLVEADATVLDTYRVSGRKNTPRPGTYKVFSKSLHARATHGGITMRYMVRFTHASSGVPIGFHDLPRYSNGRPMQTWQQLGTYQSGGCVRQDRAHAIQLYEWAPIGTRVVVLR